MASTSRNLTCAGVLMDVISGSENCSSPGTDRLRQNVFSTCLRVKISPRSLDLERVKIVEALIEG